MNFWQKVFQFYVYSNLHVALATFCLVKVTLLPYTSSNLEALFVGFATLLGYNFIRFYAVPKEEVFLSGFIEKYKKALVVLCVLSVLGMGLLAYRFDTYMLLLLVPFGLLTFFYGVPILHRFPKLRNVRSLKIFLIALVYVGATVLWPVLENGIHLDITIGIEAIQRLLFIIVITLPFDIRDLQVDSQDLGTLPQLLGVKKTKVLGVALILLFFLLEFLKPINADFLVTGLIALMALLFLVFTSIKKSIYYASFWVEAVPVFWLVGAVFHFYAT